jgi:hypothetical protein
MANKGSRHEIVVDKDMVAFVEVHSNLKQFFHDCVSQAIFLVVVFVFVFLRSDPSLCQKPQAVARHRVTQHPKFDSPTVVVVVTAVAVVVVGQILHETGFVFDTYEAFIDTNFLMRGVVMPKYPVCMVHRGLVPCRGIVI